MRQASGRRIKVFFWSCFALVVYFLARISVTVNGYTYDKPSYAILWTVNPSGTNNAFVRIVINAK